MIYRASGIYYIQTKNHILKYRTNVDKLSVYRELPEPDQSFFENSKETTILKIYEYEIIKQIFGGGNADRRVIKWYIV